MSKDTVVKTSWNVGDLCRIEGNVYRIEEVYTKRMNGLPDCRVVGNAWFDDMTPVEVKQ